MRFLISALALFTTLSTAATSFASQQVSVAFGASVPADPTGATLVEKHGPSRSNGGEHFIVKLNGAKTITDIKLTGYSTAKLGKALIHSATGINGTVKTPLLGLYQFDKVTTGNPVNYQKLAMLTDSLFVETAPNQAFTSLDIVVEGFTNDDSSLLMQITSSDALPVTDFLITRSGSSGEVVGQMINETQFAKFSPENLQALMSRSVSPAVADLAGKTFVCTSYTKLNAMELNFKSRTYNVANGVLQSSSDLEGVNLTWTGTPEGVELAVDNFDGCGKHTTKNIIRITGAGNLVSEVVLDLNAYVALCTTAGFDPAGVLAVETNSTFPSLINPKYVVDSYEFCHPTP